jgi:hypothetical protein
MATLKEMRQSTRWIGSTKKGKKLSKLDQFKADDTEELDEAKFAKLTVPGQSKSVTEMMDRYEKGRPIPE